MALGLIGSRSGVHTPDLLGGLGVGIWRIYGKRDCRKQVKKCMVPNFLVFGLGDIVSAHSGGERGKQFEALLSGLLFAWAG
jgi:hypothetical protein